MAIFVTHSLAAFAVFFPIEPVSLTQTKSYTNAFYCTAIGTDYRNTLHRKMDSTAVFPEILIGV